MASLSGALELLLAAATAPLADSDLGGGASLGEGVLAAESCGDDFFVADRRGRRLGGFIPDAHLPRAVRELGRGAEIVVSPGVSSALLRAIRDQPPALLVLTGPADSIEAAHLEELRHLNRGRRSMALLGPEGRLYLRAPAPDPGLQSGGLFLIAADGGELERLRGALDPFDGPLLALAPTPPWLPTWLRAPFPIPGQHGDLLGYAPVEALGPAWVEWLGQLGERETLQLVVPLGVPTVELEARAAHLDQVLVAHTFERFVGPIYPAPQVLARLREALIRDLRDLRDLRDHATEASSAQQEPSPDSNQRAMWAQARRALPRLGEFVGMAEPDPCLSLRVPTAAFLAQRGLLRARACRALLAQGLARPGSPPGPDLIERADAVLEGAGEVLSDHESKVVLRGHGIEVTRQAFATSASGAASFADKIGYPVALKALSPDLRRKAEVGAVELDVSNAAAAKRAYSQIVANVEERAPLARLDGVVVAEMIQPGLDLRCGALRTGSDGLAIYALPVVAAPAEPVLARSPLSVDDALLMAEAVLAGVPLPARRRASDPDVAVLARLLLALDGLLQHTGERLLSINLDPVRLLPSTKEKQDGAREYVTLDARIVQRPHIEGR